MDNNEVKPSFSLKYLLLTALTAAIVGGVGFGLSKIYESKPNRELTVVNGYSINIIENSLLPKDKFEIEYYLKGEERKKIASLFRKKVIIKNTGNIGVDNLNVTAVLKEKDVWLIGDPKIESQPPNIVDAISVTKLKESTQNKHYWVVSLLNPGESISFDYSAFSEHEEKIVSLDVIPRKKDWSVINEELSLSKKESFSTIIFSGSFALIGMMLLPLLIAYPFYRFQWDRRPDYRERYGSFGTFYNQHRPWKLFEPERVANKKKQADA